MGHMHGHTHITQLSATKVFQARHVPVMDIKLYHASVAGKHHPTPRASVNLVFLAGNHIQPLDVNYKNMVVLYRTVCLMQEIATYVKIIADAIQYMAHGVQPVQIAYHARLHQ